MRSWAFLVWILLSVQVVFSQGWRGVDVSFLSEMEGDGVVYRDENGADIDAPREWMAEQGVNLVRLRVWHNPHLNLRNSWLGVVREAAKWDSLDVPILIDYHFSDTWADPAHQETPAAWEGMSFEELQNAMTCWLHCTLEELNDKGIELAMVQLGNEIDPGMMLPYGGIDNGFGSLAELLSSGHEVVEQVFPNCQVVVHVSSVELAPWYFEALSEAGYMPDVVAVSQYSKWHLRDIDAISDAVASLSQTTGVPVFIAETAYAWTTDWSDWTDNLWWIGDETPGYPFSPAGQWAYLEALHAALDDLGPSVCSGWCYWAPDWVASQGETSVEGSAWENAALFDFQWGALPAWEVFNP
jgi:arabinogalactan endo-1,4-beta-galactosidase